MRGGTILSERQRETIAFIERFMGFKEIAREDTTTRLKSDSGDVIDVRDAGGFWTAAPGTGTIDHIAVRALDRAHVLEVSAELNDAGHGPTSVHDRKYFYSLYVREPGTLMEMATDGPGFAIDESAQRLGSELFIPPHFLRDEDDIRVILPQFGMPGEPRTIYRDLPFIHRLHVPDAPDGSTLFLLHGTGGSETSLMPLGRRVAPNATLIGVRGRSLEEGVARFFRRFDTRIFDQKDVVAEAEAFEAFVEGAASAYDIDANKMTFMGYSNGANLLGAAMLLHPGLIRNAILLRPMMVLDTVPEAALAASRVLLVVGADDPLAAEVEPLARALKSAGVDVTRASVPAGHELADADHMTAAAWMSAPHDPS